MAWIRLTDNYLDDEQIQALSDGAFRLWHEGVAYARRNQTDGLIPFVSLRGFRAFTKAREQQLSTVHREGLEPLWTLVPRLGYRIKSYLKWNPSRDEEAAEREGAAARMRRLRLERSSPPCSPEQIPEHAPEVPERAGEDRSSSGKGTGENPDDIATRAGRLREELYPRWYATHRRGARLRLVASNLEYQDAMTLVQTWDDARLEKLARIVLTTDDPWISRTDRSFKIFAMKASWADDRLRQAESGAA